MRGTQMRPLRPRNIYTRFQRQRTRMLVASKRGIFRNHSPQLLTNEAYPSHYEFIDRAIPFGFQIGWSHTEDTLAQLEADEFFILSKIDLPQRPSTLREDHHLLDTVDGTEQRHPTPWGANLDTRTRD